MGRRARPYLEPDFPDVDCPDARLSLFLRPPPHQRHLLYPFPPRATPARAPDSQSLLAHLRLASFVVRARFATGALFEPRPSAHSFFHSGFLISTHHGAPLHTSKRTRSVADAPTLPRRRPHGRVGPSGTLVADCRECLSPRSLSQPNVSYDASGDLVANWDSTGVEPAAVYSECLSAPGPGLNPPLIDTPAS